MFGKRILKNTVVLAVGKVIVIGLSFFTLTLTTHYLGPEGYGMLGTVTVFLSFFAISSDLGLSLFGLRELAQSKKDTGELLSSLFTLRVLMSIGSMAAALLIGMALGYSKATVIGIAIMCPTLILNTATSAISIYFQHNLHMRYVALGEVISKIISLAGLVYVLHAKLGINAFFWLNVLGAAIFCGSVFWFARKHVRLKFVYDPVYWKKALWLSIPLGLASVLNTIYYRLDTLMLSLLNLSHSIVSQFNNFQAVGLYSVPYRLIEVIMVFPGLFIVSVFPVMARQADFGELWAKRAQRAYDFLIIFAVPMVLLVWLFSAQIIRVVGGPGFEPSVQLLNILIMAVAFSFLNAFLGFLLVTRHHERDILKLSVITISTNFIFNFFLIPIFSFYAAAWMSLASEALCFFVSIYFVWRRFQLIPSHRAVWKCLAAAVISCLPILWVSHVPMVNTRQTLFVTLSAGVAFSLIYFPLLIPFRAVKIQDIRETLQLTGKSVEEAP